MGDRLWHSTDITSTPTAIISALLDTVTTEDVWGHGPSTRATEATGAFTLLGILFVCLSFGR